MTPIFKPIIPTNSVLVGDWIRVQPSTVKIKSIIEPRRTSIRTDRKPITIESYCEKIEDDISPVLLIEKVSRI